MSAPTRVQLRRTKGWRKPEGAVVVARPSKWGNPWRVIPFDGGYKVQGQGDTIVGYDRPFTKAEAAEIAVERFRERAFRPGSINAREAEIHLAGRDLACWCPLDQPCHADVLLEIANGGIR